MGALDAFVGAFSLVRKSKQLYIILLALAILLALIGAYILPSNVNVPVEHNATVRNQNVIFTEYGGSGEKVGDWFVGMMEDIAIYLLIAAVITAPFEYAVTKALLLQTSGDGYSFESLLVEGLKNLPGVLLVNLIYGGLVLLFVGVGLIPVLIGLLVLPAGAVLVALGLALLMFLLFFTVGMATLAIPAYVEGGLAASFDALKLAFGNVRSTTVFGLLLLVALFAIVLASMPLLFIVQSGLEQNLASYVSSLLQAPFDALTTLFLWAAGVAFYRELQKREDLKKVDDELRELGIDI